MPLPCKFPQFIFHDWGQWVGTNTGQVISTSADGSTHVIGHYYDQQRKCTHCNFVQLKRRFSKQV